MAVAELEFRVMASRTQVVLVDPAHGAGDYARRRLEDLEERWSRFRPASDVSRLNETAGGLMLVASESLTLLFTMKEAWRVTGGRYDPTMLDAIVAAGYTTSTDGSGRRSRGTARPASGLTIDDVTVESSTGVVTVPPGIGLDPGGIGKGLAADIVVTELLERGTAGALVAVGGDLAAAGKPPTADGWPVAVEDPRAPDTPLLTFGLEAGGVATSSTLSRRWLEHGVPRHHAIDPETGTCAATDLAGVTVVARAGWEAEAHATGALLCGSGRVLDYFELHGLEGVATTLDGVTVTSPDFEGLLEDERRTA